MLDYLIGTTTYTFHSPQDDGDRRRGKEQVLPSEFYSFAYTAILILSPESVTEPSDWQILNKHGHKNYV